jgi:hypothetical protein
MAANRSGLTTSTIRNLPMAWVMTKPAAILLSEACSGCSRKFLNRLAFEDRMAARGITRVSEKPGFLQQRPELRLGAFTPAGQDHYQQIHRRL